MAGSDASPLSAYDNVKPDARVTLFIPRLYVRGGQGDDTRMRERAGMSLERRGDVREAQGYAERCAPSELEAAARTRVMLVTRIQSNRERDEDEEASVAYSAIT